MSQSKSILMPFIIISALLFGGALAWKMLGNKETGSTEKEAKEAKEVVEVKKPKVKQEITIKNYDAPEPLPMILTKDEKIEQKKISRNFMRFSMQFQNKAAIEKGLQDYKNSGNREQFEHLAMFADENFPDVEIPSFE